VDKSLAVVDGKSLIQRVVGQITPISNQIIVVGSPCRFDFPSDLGIEYKEDLYPGKGPLGGIYTGLLASKAFYSLVVACDMPFLNIELLRHMIKLSPGFDAVVPRVKRIQPLHAVYSKSCLNDMKARLEDNQLGVTRFLSTINVRYVERAECQSFDTQLLSFFNINSRADLAKANMLVAQRNAGLGNKDNL
jgi:molybdopterin-guanine dinucleotide biosynthesis protein A